MNNLTKKEASEKKILFVRRSIAYIVLIVLTILCLFSFYILFINSSRAHAQIQAGFNAIPGKSFFANLREVFNKKALVNMPIHYGMLNSLIVSVLTAGTATYFSAMTAYGIHVYNFKFKQQLFMFILLIMMVPAQVSALGFVRMMRQLGLTNNFIPLIVPAIASPAVFFFMKQYMESTLHLEIVEASRIDGANEFKTFNRIVLPIMQPAIAVQAIFAFVASWNNYFIPNLLIDKQNMKTLPILIAQLRQPSNTEGFSMAKVYMTIFVTIIPVIIIYLCLSKFIVRGIAVGGVKE